MSTPEPSRGEVWDLHFVSTPGHEQPGTRPALILSDDTIVERLRESGIDIARRTVAKYREAMRIPSSVQRRRDKQSMLGHALSAPAASDRSRDTQPA